MYCLCLSSTKYYLHVAMDLIVITQIEMDPYVLCFIGQLHAYNLRCQSSDTNNYIPPKWVVLQHINVSDELMAPW